MRNYYSWQMAGMDAGLSREIAARLTADAELHDAPGNGPFSWYRAISSSEKRAFWSCRVGYLLDAMDSQFLSFVIPTLIATWGITRGDAGLIGTRSRWLTSAVGGWAAGALSDRNLRGQRQRAHRPEHGFKAGAKRREPRNAFDMATQQQRLARARYGADIDPDGEDRKSASAPCAVVLGIETADLSGDRMWANKGWLRQGAVKPFMNARFAYSDPQSNHVALWRPKFQILRSLRREKPIVWRGSVKPLACPSARS
jgi:hypothetical protein